MWSQNYDTGSYDTLYQVDSRARISCCAVARAQHLGQNSRFAQQPPQGWLRAAQHVILGAQHFSPQLRVFFWPLRRKKKLGPFFSTSPQVIFFLKLIYVYVVCVTWRRHTRRGIGERHRSPTMATPTMANGEYSIDMFLVFIDRPGCSDAGPELLLTSVV